MKKLILLLSLALAISSCSKSSDFVEDNFFKGKVSHMTFGLYVCNETLKRKTILNNATQFSCSYDSDKNRIEVSSLILPDADPKPLNMDVATEKCKSELYSIRELRDAVDDNVAMLWGRFSYLRGFFEGNIRYENSENINNKILLELSKILVYEVEIIHPYKDKWGEARKYTCTWTMKGGLEPSVREEPLS